MDGDSEYRSSEDVSHEVHNEASFSQSSSFWEVTSWKVLSSWKGIDLWKRVTSLKSFVPWMSNTQQLDDQKEDGEPGDPDSLVEAMPVRWMEKYTGDCRNLSSLPNELLDDVFWYLGRDDWGSQPVTATIYPTNEEYPYLKTLRLVSKAVNAIVTPYLFETVVLYQHTKRWDELNQIAHSPNLAPLVKHLKLAQLPWLPFFRTYDQWCAASKPGRGYRGFMTEHPPAGGPLAKMDFQSTEEGYQRYAAWRRGESAMRRHESRGTAPPLDLQLLINLESIQTVGLAELTVIKRKPWQRWHGLWKAGPATRRHFETGLLDGNFIHGWHLSTNRSVTETHLPLMILAFRQTGKHLNALKLRSINELLSSPEIDESQVTLEFPSLQHLCINTFSTRQNVRQLAEVSSWVKSLKDLKTLHITQHPRSRDERDIIKMLAKVHLASLAEIEINYARTTFVSLANFIARHFDTLSVISITRPVMTAESWALFRGGFLDEWGKLHANKKILLSEECFR